MFGRYGGLCPYPQRYGGKPPAEAAFLESLKRAFPDGYSREQGTLIEAEHIADARRKAAIKRKIEAVRADSIPHTAHLNILDWAKRLGVVVNPTWTEEELRERLVERYESVAGNDIIRIRAKVRELLGDSFVALKRYGDKKAKVIQCVATNGSSSGLAPVYPMVSVAASLGAGSDSIVSQAVIGQVPLTASATFLNPGDASAALSIQFIGDNSVWVAASAVDATATDTSTQAVTIGDDVTALLAFVALKSDDTTILSVEFDGNAMAILGSVVAAGSSDTDTRVAVYFLAVAPTDSGDLEVIANAMGGTSPKLSVYALQLEDFQSSVAVTATATNGEKTISVVSGAVDTDVEFPLDSPPVPTYWPVTPAPAHLQPHLLRGWMSARARYSILARRGTTYTSDDAVKRRIDTAVHDYLDRVIKSTESYDYSIGDLEGFILGQSRLGYVAF